MPLENREDMETMKKFTQNHVAKGLASNDTDWLQAKEGKPKMPVSWGYFFCCSEMLVHFPETRYTVCSSASLLGREKTINKSMPVSGTVLVTS